MPGKRRARPGKLGVHTSSPPRSSCRKTKPKPTHSTFYLVMPPPEQQVGRKKISSYTIPSDEMYIMLGDFNARVGSRQGEEDPWGHVRGPHGYGECNDAGRELLTFLSTNEAVICNTWLKRKIFTNRHGSTLRASNGTASTLPSCVEETAGDA